MQGVISSPSQTETKNSYGELKLVLYDAVTGLKKAVGQLELSSNSRVQFTSMDKEGSKTVAFDIPLHSIQRASLTTALSDIRLNIFVDGQRYIIGALDLETRSYTKPLPRLQQAIDLLENEGISINQRSVNAMRIVARVGFALVAVLALLFVAVQIYAAIISA